jgi:hypothetical protein
MITGHADEKRNRHKRERGRGVNDLPADIDVPRRELLVAWTGHKLSLADCERMLNLSARAICELMDRKRDTHNFIGWRTWILFQIEIERFPNIVACEVFDNGRHD